MVNTVPFKMLVPVHCKDFFSESDCILSHLEERKTEYCALSRHPVKFLRMNDSTTIHIIAAYADIDYLWIIFQIFKYFQVFFFCFFKY